VFLGHHEVTNLLEESLVSDISELAKSPEKVSALTEILQGLVAEKVPITALDDLCRFFIDNYGHKTAEYIIEKMRMLNKVREKLPGNSKDYTLLPIGEDFEKVLAKAVVETSSLHLLAMEPEICQNALTSIRNAVSGVRRAALVVHEPSLRIHLRKLVELEFPHLHVLSQRELAEDLSPDQSRVVNFK